MINSKNYNQIPVYLTTTCEMLKKTFPNGLDEMNYFVLITLLYEEMSDRNLAVALSSCFDIDYSVVINDIYKVGTDIKVDEAAKEKLRILLDRHGFQEWLNE